MEVGISLKRKRWKMKCIQIIELVRSTEESVEAVKEYLASAADETELKRIAICEDRHKAGLVISIAEFTTWEDAPRNSDLDVTNEAA